MSDTRSLDLESDEAERLSDAAAALSSQIIYNGEVLDIAVESLRSYRPGTQSLGYLESAVNLAWAVFKMLERWGKEQIGGLKGEMYVRKKKRARRKSEISRFNVLVLKFEFKGAVATKNMLLWIMRKKKK